MNESERALSTLLKDLTPEPRGPVDLAAIAADAPGPSLTPLRRWSLPLAAAATLAAFAVLTTFLISRGNSAEPGQSPGRPTRPVAGPLSYSRSGDASATYGPPPTHRSTRSRNSTSSSRGSTRRSRWTSRWPRRRTRPRRSTSARRHWSHPDRAIRRSPKIDLKACMSGWFAQSDSVGGRWQPDNET
jgi:hypothetical protein